MDTRSFITTNQSVTGHTASVYGQNLIPIVTEPRLKRLLDILLAGVMLLLSSPIWLLTAIAIKIEDGGPVFFSQERWGRGGQIFKVRKFRTMIVNAGLHQAQKNDSRITRVGAFLRSCGMDELPQLLNIWIGDMSFVGPRALAVGEMLRDEKGNYTTYEHIPGYWDRLAVRPGLTGIATIYIPKDAHPRRKFRYDRFYIQRQCCWLDVRLIMLSFIISFRGKWETRERKL